MTAPVRLPNKPRGMLRWLAKAPVTLYRLRLGWLLGRRFLLLTHRGRTSGRVYRTVVEVPVYDKRTHEAVVVAGFGEKTDWYRNLLAHPALEIAIGSRRFVPRQHLLTPDEREAVLLDYVHQHPVAARTLFRVVGYPYDGTDASLRALAGALPMVAFRPA